MPKINDNIRNVFDDSSRHVCALMLSCLISILQEANFFHEKEIIFSFYMAAF